MKSINKKILIILLLSLIIFTSCDIQKKRYSRGYTVNWNKKHQNRTKLTKYEPANDVTIVVSKIESLETNINSNDDIIVSDMVENNIDEPIILESNNSIEEKQTIQISSITPIIYAKKENRGLIRQECNKHQPRSISNQKNAENNKKINGLAVAALVLSLLFFLIYIPTIISFILGIIALVKIKKNPELYSKSSKKTAIAALILDLLFSLLIISLLFSFLTGLITIILLTVLIIAIVSSIKTNSPNQKPSINSKPKKGYKQNQFWLKNRLLALFILVFAALLLIPLTI
jgi:hypothetical protein